jgi:hypothetical protein
MRHGTAFTSDPIPTEASLRSVARYSFNRYDPTELMIAFSILYRNIMLAVQRSACLHPGGHHAAADDTVQYCHSPTIPGMMNGKEIRTQ